MPDDVRVWATFDEDVAEPRGERYHRRECSVITSWEKQGGEITHYDNAADAHYVAMLTPCAACKPPLS